MDRWLAAALDYVPKWIEHQMRITGQPGCVIAVAGMIYAFYVKPVIKRRNREAVLASLAKDERSLDA